MLIMFFTITIILGLGQVNGNNFCIGTCYSGRLFPKPQDIFHGKHLKGFSYKNITTDDPRKCYSACAQDCRCKACQMKDARCELLDEDKTTKADNFVAESGYVYYDLKQTMYQGTQRSHMVRQDSCDNGCCRSQSCVNGGTCIERCRSSKEKFTCRCPRGYGGILCETQFKSCKSVLTSSRTFPKDGVYWINQVNVFVPVYCSFEQSPARAWTLIESFGFEKKADFKYKSFYLDYPVNFDDPLSWERFRMGHSTMVYIRSKSTLFRATCDFPKRNGALTPDLLIGRLSDVDIMTFRGTYGECKRFMFIDIRGHSCTNCTALTFQGNQGKNRHFYIDVTHDNYCQFIPPHTVESVDSFGFYGVTEPVSRCTDTPKSTTQWWLGEEE